ncbi:MAG: GNAT family N-acetyltransferase [Promethearchaeota archaeon]
MKDDKKRVKRRIEQIVKRVKRLKISHVIEVGDPSVEKGKQFRYIIMNLPVDKISSAKLSEMEAKCGFIHKMVKVRPASRDDIPDLCDLYNTAFFQCPDPYRPISLADMEQIFQKSTIIIAYLYGAPAGFIIIKMETKELEGGAHEKIGVIAGIAVHPRHRNKGVATAIGLEAWGYLEDKGLDYLQCEVYEQNNPSLSFITWVGFRPVGELIMKVPSASEINPLERI